MTETERILRNLAPIENAMYRKANGIIVPEYVNEKIPPWSLKESIRLRGLQGLIDELRFARINAA